MNLSELKKRLVSSLMEYIEDTENDFYEGQGIAIKALEIWKRDLAKSSKMSFSNTKAR